MTHTLQPVSLLRQRMTDDMRMRQLAPKTQASYLRVMREFTRFLGRSPDTATVEGSATLPIASGRPRRVTRVAQCGNHRTEATLNTAYGHARSRGRLPRAWALVATDCAAESGTAEGHVGD